MKRYNLSEIMKNAWALMKGTEGFTFAECLKLSWKNAKENAPKKKIMVKRHIQIMEVAKWVLKKMDGVSFLALDAGIAADDIILERETEKAIEISTEWDGLKKIMWLPKSACCYRFA